MFKDVVLEGGGCHTEGCAHTSLQVGVEGAWISTVTLPQYYNKKIYICHIVFVCFDCSQPQVIYPCVLCPCACRRTLQWGLQCPGPYLAAQQLVAETQHGHDLQEVGCLQCVLQVGHVQVDPGGVDEVDNVLQTGPGHSMELDLPHLLLPHASWITAGGRNKAGSSEAALTLAHPSGSTCYIICSFVYS